MKVEEYNSFFKSRFKVTSSFFSGISMMLVDAIIVMLSIGAGFFIVNLINPPSINFKSFVTYSVYVPVILIVFCASGLYPGLLLAPQEEVKRFSIGSFLSFIGIAIIINKESSERYPIALAMIIAWPFATLFLPIFRQGFRSILGKIHVFGVPAVIYAKNEDDLKIVDRLLEKEKYGYRPALIILQEPRSIEEYKSIPVFNKSEELARTVSSLNIKVAILCEYFSDIERIHSIYRYIINIPRKQNFIAMSLHIRDFGGILGYATTNELTKSFSLMVKRIVDLVICILASPFFLIITSIIALLIKIDSRGPVFYGHERIGKDRKKIKCWKFRSMYRDSNERLKEILANNPDMAKEWEENRKFTNDPRVTRIGKFLRKTSLDELPQLLNIFMGEMSFVGPRPVTKDEISKYGASADYILTVKPGLSGMWQISGRSDTSYEERITLDTYYVQNWSVWLDLWIIVKTIWVVLLEKGAV